MCRVIYNGNLISPIQTVGITKQNQKSGDGKIIGKVFNIVVAGTLLFFRGSPKSDGSFWTLSGSPPDENIGLDSRFASLQRKKEAIRDLFKTEGLVFELAPLDGSPSVKCNPRIISIEFLPSEEHTLLSFTITLETDELYPKQEDTFDQYISDAQESWSIDTDETPEGFAKPRHFRLSHSISAVGKRFYDSAGLLVKEAWQQARTYVQAKLGFDSVIAFSSGVNNLPSYYAGRNHIRAENIGKTDGNYSVTESWVLSSGAFLEEFNVSVGQSQEAMTRVTVNGNIQGLETRDTSFNITQTKYEAASAQFTIASGLAFTRAQNYSGRNLNLSPLNFTYGLNPIAGNINYSMEYDDRPSRLVTGTKSESISIGNNYGVDLFAVIPVLGRATGPVIQNLGSKQETQRSLELSLIFDTSYIPSGTSTADMLNLFNPRLRSPQSTEIAAIITAAKPVGNALNNDGNAATKEFISSRNETFNPLSKSYSLNISWSYE